MKIAGLVLLGALVGVAGAQDAPEKKLVSWLAVLDKPYTGMREYDREQKMPNGKTLVKHNTTKFWRDSGGRTLSEVTINKNKPVSYILLDPVGQVQYRWTDAENVAYMVKLGPPNHVKTEKDPLKEGEVRDVNVKLDGERLKARVSLLPPKILLGMPTVGTHELTYSDPDRKVLQSTVDFWYQQEFCVTLEEKIIDQHYGRREWKYRSFKAEEPNAELFQVPKGYKIKAEEKPDTDQFE